MTQPPGPDVPQVPHVEPLTADDLRALRGEAAAPDLPPPPAPPAPTAPMPVIDEPEPAVVPAAVGPAAVAPSDAPPTTPTARTHHAAAGGEPPRDPSATASLVLGLISVSAVTIALIQRATVEESNGVTYTQPEYLGVVGLPFIVALIGFALGCIAIYRWRKGRASNGPVAVFGVILCAAGMALGGYDIYLHTDDINEQNKSVSTDPASIPTPEPLPLPSPLPTVPTVPPPVTPIPPVNPIQPITPTPTVPAGIVTPEPTVVTLPPVSTA